MKKLYKIFFVLLAPLLLLPACIQDEPLGIEADILEVVVPDLPTEIRYGADTIRLNKGVNQIDILITANSRVGYLSPEFVLTQGATIYPPSGTTLDFSNFEGQRYVVTSECGSWHREYIVRVRPPFILTADEGGNGTTRTFSFENFQEFEGRFNYHEFYERDLSDRKEFIWASGNPGFALTNANAPAENYPTFSTPAGKSGSGVQLVTRSTGPFGEMVGMPIAAGNLFLGSFDVSQALSTPLQATRFGVPYAMGEPLRLEVWYKFQGGIFTDKDDVEQQDFPHIYAVLFKPEVIDSEIILLDGANVLTAANIISVAELAPSDVVHSDNIGTAEFSHASIPFVLRDGKTIDAQKLANGEYYITIVFASSSRGPFFEGFVGSTLIVDEVKLITR